MYRIYIHNKPLCIINNPGDAQLSNREILLDSPSDDSLKEAVFRFANDPEHTKLFLAGKDTEKNFRRLCSLFIPTEAAGGIVQNESGQFLFILRHGIWDLPKGKMEEGESVTEAAIREVQEETGLNEVSVVKALDTTYHTYQEGDIPILKKTYWFLMKSRNCHTIRPQEAEDITSVKWFDKDQIRKEILPVTYASLRDLVDSIL